MAAMESTDRGASRCPGRRRPRPLGSYSRLAAAGAALIAGLLLAAGTAAADAPTATVTGEATLSAKPDVALLRLSVVSEDESSRTAAETNAKRAQAVIGALRERMAADAELWTEGFSLQPQYDHDRTTGESRLRGYRASNTVALRLSALDRAGEAIDVAVAAGANQVQSLSFALRADAGLRDRALAEATRRARGRADVVAEALGARVVRVVSVEEGGGPPVPRPYAMMEMRQADATPIEVGDVEVRASVVMVVELKD